MKTVGDVSCEVVGEGETNLQILNSRWPQRVEICRETRMCGPDKAEEKELRDWRGVLLKLTSNLWPFTKEHG